MSPEMIPRDEDLRAGNAIRHVFGRSRCRPDSDGRSPSNPQWARDQVLNETTETPASPDRVSVALAEPETLHHIPDRRKSNGLHPGLTQALDIHAPWMRVYSDAARPLVDVKPCNEPAPDIHGAKSDDVMGDGTLLTSTENAPGLSKAAPPGDPRREIFANSY